MSDGGSVWGTGWGPPSSPEPVDSPPAGDGARLGDLLEAAIALTRRGGALLVGGVVAIALLSVALETVVVWLLVRSVEVDLDSGVLPVRDLLDLTWRSVGVGATALATSWLVWVSTAALAAAVQAEPGPAPIRAAVRSRIRRSAGGLLRLLAAAWALAALLVAAAIGPAAIAARWGIAETAAGLLFGVVGAAAAALVLIPRLALAPVAVVAESTGAAGGLRHAWEVSGGRYLRVAAVLGLNAVVTHSVAALLAAPLGAVEMRGDLSEQVIDAPLLIAGGAVGALAVIVTAPFTASLLAVCYADLRRRQYR